MRKIIVLVFTLLFVTTSFSMLQRQTAEPITAKLQNISSDIEIKHTLTTKLSTHPIYLKQQRNSEVDRILQDYRKGFVLNLAVMGLSAGGVYTATKLSPVLSEYSAPLALLASLHVGVFSNFLLKEHICSKLNPNYRNFSRGEDFDAFMGLIGVFAIINGLSLLFSRNINHFFFNSISMVTVTSILLATMSPYEIHELAEKIKSKSDVDLSSSSDKD